MHYHLGFASGFGSRALLPTAPRLVWVGIIAAGFSSVACSQVNTTSAEARPFNSLNLTTTISDSAIPVRHMIVDQLPPLPEAIVIPVPEARDVTFRYLSPKPLLIAAANVIGQNGRPIGEIASIKTLGRVMLQSGLEVGQDCAEHLREGDVVAHGAFQNAGNAPIVIELASGQAVMLKPAQGVYVGDDYYAVVFNQLISSGNKTRGHGEAIPTVLHTIQCQCMCTCSDGTQEPHEFPCGAVCNLAGNQCGMDGQACTAHGSIHDCQGVEQGCHEEIVPVTPPDPPKRGGRFRR